MDKIDVLIDMLNAAIDIPFLRDAVSEDRPDEWGAVELRGEAARMTAGDTVTDTAYRVDVILCVEDLGSEWIWDVQEVFDAFDRDVDMMKYRFPERTYIQEIGRAAWRWECRLYSPLEIAEDADEADEDEESAEGTEAGAGTDAESAGTEAESGAAADG